MPFSEPAVEVSDATPVRLQLASRTALAVHLWCLWAGMWQGSFPVPALDPFTGCHEDLT